MICSLSSRSRFLVNVMGCKIGSSGLSPTIQLNRRLNTTQLASEFLLIGNSMDPELQRRYRQLFRFYDLQGDGSLSVEGDFQQVAEALAARWQHRNTPFPDMLGLLLGTYAHESERRDLNHDGVVDELEFVDSHAPVVQAFLGMRPQAEAFIARAAGAFFDCLDLDCDGVLEVGDLEAYAAAYRKPTEGIRANLARMLAAFALPPDRLPRQVFLTLVEQYWFDPSPDVPGRWLFTLDCPTDASC